MAGNDASTPTGGNDDAAPDDGAAEVEEEQPTASGESASDESSSDESVSVESASDETASGESVPVESASDESVPDESVSGESASGESVSVESASSESVSVESASVESAADAPTVEAVEAVEAVDAVPSTDELDAVEVRNELAELKAENARLAGELQQVAAGAVTAPAKPRQRGRWFVSWALIVVGSLLVPVSVMSIWINRTITATDRYVETVAPLIRDKDIQAAIEKRLQEALYQRVDLQSEVQQVLPERAALLAAPITAGLKNLISEIVNRVVTSDKVAQLWVDANRIAQKQVVDVLTVSNGQKGVVTIDLTATLKEAQQQLAAAGVPFIGNVSVPEVKLDVLQSDALGKVQTAFGIFDKLAMILPWLTLAILGAGIAVAPDRRKGLVRASSGWVIASALLLVTIAIGRVMYLDALPSGASIPANTAFFNTISRFLRGSGRMVLVLGLVMLVVALVTGPSAPAVRLRLVVSRLFGAASSGVDRTGVDLGPVPAFVGRNLMLLRAAVGIGALVVFLLLGQPSAGAVLWIVLGALVVLAVVEVLGRAGLAAAAATAAPAAVGSSSAGDELSGNGGGDVVAAHAVEQS